MKREDALEMFPADINKSQQQLKAVRMINYTTLTDLWNNRGSCEIMSFHNYNWQNVRRFTKYSRSKVCVALKQGEQQLENSARLTTFMGIINKAILYIYVTQISLVQVQVLF